MHDIVIIRYAEIALKGKNRIQFEKRLVHNISLTLKNCRIPYSKIFFRRGRIFILTAHHAEELRHVPGIASFSYAKSCVPEVGAIIKSADSVIGDFLNYGGNFGSFRVSANRMDDSIKMSSVRLNTLLGEHIRKSYGRKVRLKGFELEISVEIFEGKAYVFTKKEKGIGGLPVGSTGKVLVLADRDSVFLAAELIMRRGARVIFAVQAGDTGKIRKIGELENYNCFEGFRVAEYTTISNLPALARKQRAKAIVVGLTYDKLGELGEFRQACPENLVLAPLIGIDTGAGDIP